MPKKKPIPRRVKKAKRNLRIQVLVSLSMIMIFGISFSLQIGDGRSPGYKPNLASPTPTPSSTSTSPADTTSIPATRTEQYNAVDSMAILGAFAIASQVPQKTGLALNKFIAKLENAKKNPYKSSLDVGVKGNKLVDYALTPEGFANLICFAVEAPIIEGQSPKQPTWVISLEFTPKDKLPLVAIMMGVISCDQAKLAAKTTKYKDRVTTSEVSRLVLGEAILKIPPTFLTKIGLQLSKDAQIIDTIKDKPKP